MTWQRYALYGIVATVLLGGLAGIAGSTFNAAVLPSILGFVIVALIVIVVLATTSIRLAHMIDTVAARGKYAQTVLVSIGEEDWRRLTGRSTGLYLVKYAVVGAGREGLAVFSGMGDPQLVAIVASPLIESIDVTRKRLGARTRPAVAIKTRSEGGSISLVPMSPALRGLRDKDVKSIVLQLRGLIAQSA